MFHTAHDIGTTHFPFKTVPQTSCGAWFKFKHPGNKSLWSWNHKQKPWVRWNDVIKNQLTVQLLHCHDVVPAQHQAAAELPVVRWHQSVTDRRVLQSQSVSDLVGGHHEQVVSFVSVQRPPLCHVEVGFAPTRQEGVSQGSSWESKQKSEDTWCHNNNFNIPAVTSDWLTK